METETNAAHVVNKLQLTADYFRKYHFGRDNAVFCAELQRIFHLSDKEIRDKVNAMRLAGEPICSGNRGYWYAACDGDIKDTISGLDKLINGLENAKNGLLLSLSTHEIGPVGQDTNVTDAGV